MNFAKTAALAASVAYAAEAEQFHNQGGYFLNSDDADDIDYHNCPVEEFK